MIKNFIDKTILILGIVGLLGAPGLLASSTVAALDCSPANQKNLTTQEQAKCGVRGVGGGTAKNSGDQVQVIIRNVINILLFLIGLVAVLMIVIAGFRFVTSNGDSNIISSARNTILYAIIGIIIAIMAYAIVNFILDNLT